MLDASKLIEPVSGLLGKLITDKDQAARLSHEIATMAERHGQEIKLATTGRLYLRTGVNGQLLDRTNMRRVWGSDTTSRCRGDDAVAVGDARAVGR